MRSPPIFYPKNLDKQFASDPFDDRMHTAGSGRPHTSLGLLLEAWHWYITHKQACGVAFEPIANSIREHLHRECPDALQELEE